MRYTDFTHSTNNIHNPMPVSKGFVIQRIEKSAPSFDALTDTIAELQLGHVLLAILHEHPFPAETPAWIADLTKKGVTVWGWAEINPQTDPQSLTEIVAALGLTHLVLHTENHWSISAARRWMNALKLDVTLALCYPPFAAGFPLAEFRCQVLMPRIDLTSSAGSISRNLQQVITADQRVIPLAVVSGVEYTTQQRPYYWTARPDQIAELLNTATDLRLEAVQFALWEDAQRNSTLWSAINEWEYQPTKRTIAAPGISKTTPGQVTAGNAEAQLLQYGVVLGAEAGGQWATSEIETVLNVVKTIGESLAPLMQALFGIDDGLFAFRLLYAPQLIQRHKGVNVNPFNKQAVWYGYNSSGYVLHFGDKMFISGREPLKAGQGLDFDSPQIVCHEFSHTINWRYPQIATIPGRELDAYYHNTLRIGSYPLHSGEVVSLGQTNDGYSFAARSSNDDFETMTDAIANFTYNGITTDAKGDARLEQLSQLLTHVIRHRVQNFGNTAAIRSKISNISGVKAYSSTLHRALNAVSELDNQLAALVASA